MASPSTARVVKLVLLTLLFVALCAAGVAWALHSAGLDARVLTRLTALGAGWLALLLGLALLLLAVETLRFRVMGYAVGEPLRWKTCWDSMVANNFFSWLSPGAALGEPATIYVMGKQGVPWDAAVVIAFGKTVSAFLIFLGLTLIFLVAGLGPELELYYYLPFVFGLGVAVFWGGLLAFGAIWPQRAVARVDRIHTRVSSWRWLQGERASRAVNGLFTGTRRSIERLAHFKTTGWRGLVAVTCAHVLYYCAFLSILIVLGYLHGASSLPRLIPLAVIYQCFTYVAPTPGGAGLSEATASVFFGLVLEPSGAILTVLLFRSLTFYLHIVLGFVYLPFLGGILNVMRGSE